MLSVIGLEISFIDSPNIDEFDFHLYSSKSIPLNTSNGNEVLFKSANTAIDKLLIKNHLSRGAVDLILFGPNANEAGADQIFTAFASVGYRTELHSALMEAQKKSQKGGRAVLILSLDSFYLDGIAMLLVCDRHVYESGSGSQIEYCHCYANIDASSLIHLPSSKGNQVANNEAHVQSFLSAQGMGVFNIESVVSSAHETEWSRIKQRGCWAKLNTLNVDKPLATTLLTEMDIIGGNCPYLNALITLCSSVLCLDQQYRLGSVHQLSHDMESMDEIDWKNTGCYCLAQSTSYLPSSPNQLRSLVMEHLYQDSHQLVLLSNGQQHRTVQCVKNGFMKQQKMKPVICFAADEALLLAQLRVLLIKCEHGHLSFNYFCEQQYQLSQVQKASTYKVVLIANSFETLKEQLLLALAGVSRAISTNQCWKTPAGSYFSAQLTEIFTHRLPLTFIYPGIGAIYVGMGKDLLRLFPESVPHLNTVTDNLSDSLQDHLITPRMLMMPRASDHIENDKRLRAKLANIAEAGVSYACLLSVIFQQQLGLQPSSAAGYSMGEVSMFAAANIWKSPKKLGQRLRKSPIFNEQLSGSLQRLDQVWTKSNTARDEVLWESYHLKTTRLKVECYLPQFPRVFITIINTPDSLVIAGAPEQCIALAGLLKVRAIALNVKNIIHCPLAMSEYENMQQLYALPIKQKSDCKLFSTSCYLPIPTTEKAIAVSISKCLTEPVDFPRLVHKLAAQGERVFLEMGAGKSLSTWVERILKHDPSHVTSLSVNQKKMDDYSAILRTIAALISLGYHINLEPFFNGTLIRGVEKAGSTVSVS